MIWYSTNKKYNIKTLYYVWIKLLSQTLETNWLHHLRERWESSTDLTMTVTTDDEHVFLFCFLLNGIQLIQLFGQV